MVARINPVTGARTHAPRLLDYLLAFTAQASAPGPYCPATPACPAAAEALGHPQEPAPRPAH